MSSATLLRAAERGDGNGHIDESLWVPLCGDEHDRGRWCKNDRRD
jgi:hypothetical protein